MPRVRFPLPKVKTYPESRPANCGGFSGVAGRVLGVETLVTDDLATYKPVVEELGLGHQVCVGRVKKNVWDRLKVLDDEWDRLLNGHGTDAVDLERTVRAGRREVVGVVV